MMGFEMPEYRTAWRQDLEGGRTRRAIWEPTRERLYVSLLEDGKEIAVSRRYKEGDEARRFVEGICSSPEWRKVERSEGIMDFPEPKEKKATKKAAKKEVTKRTKRTAGTEGTEAEKPQVKRETQSFRLDLEFYGAMTLMRELVEAAQTDDVRTAFRKALLHLEACGR